MKPLVLFDGHCALCNRSVRWLIQHDSKRQLQFLSQEDPQFDFLLKERHLTRPSGDSLMVLDQQTWYTYSDAVFRALRYVDSPWNTLSLGRFIPKIIRNPLYRIIARYRYRIFG
ncbi:MAG: thiol-disulfide oxidoreductase DCC family protein, partial [Chitinophagaceae bacterium]